MRYCASSTPCQQITLETDWSFSLLNHLPEEVSEGEIEGLRQEKPESVGCIAFEEGSYSILNIEPSEAICDSFVSICDDTFLEQGLLDLKS